MSKGRAVCTKRDVEIPEGIDDLPSGLLCQHCGMYWLPKTAEDFDREVDEWMQRHNGGADPHNVQVIVIDDGRMITTGRVTRPN